MVPLDAEYPVERLNYMLEDSAPTVVLTQGHLRGLLSGAGEAVPVIDLADASQWKDQAETNPERTAVGLTPEHLAYVIYTSGSTGKPKGVAIGHQNLANLLHWHRDAFVLRSGQRSSSVAGFGFDAATWEIWSALCAGVALLFPSVADANNIEDLLVWWKRQELDVSFLPTPIAECAFKQDITNVRLQRLLVGGDRLRHLPSLSSFSPLINNYGPTEYNGCCECPGLLRHQAEFFNGRILQSQTHRYMCWMSGWSLYQWGWQGSYTSEARGAARGYVGTARELTAAEQALCQILSQQRVVPDCTGVGIWGGGVRTAA